MVSAPEREDMEGEESLKIARSRVELTRGKQGGSVLAPRPAKDGVSEREKRCVQRSEGTHPAERRSPVFVEEEPRGIEGVRNELS